MKSIRSLLGFKKKDTQASPQTNDSEIIQTYLALIKKYDFIETQIEEQSQIVRSHGLRKNSSARKALKKRITLQKSLEKVEGKLSNIQSQVDALSGFINMNKNVMDVLSDGALALRASNESIDLENVNECVSYQEIVDTITEPTVGKYQHVDDYELNQQLEAIEQDELNKALFTLTVTPCDYSKQEITNVDDDETSILFSSSNIKKYIKTDKISGVYSQSVSMKSMSYEEDGISLDEHRPQSKSKKEAKLVWQSNQI